MVLVAETHTITKVLLVKETLLLYPPHKVMTVVQVLMVLIMQVAEAAVLVLLVLLEEELVVMGVTVQLQILQDHLQHMLEEAEVLALQTTHKLEDLVVLVVEVQVHNTLVQERVMVQQILVEVLEEILMTLVKQTKVVMVDLENL